MTALKLRILFDGAMIGPGKAALLDGIAATGSIAAAGRQMQMSYKRAWMLVEEMNAAFALPLALIDTTGWMTPVFVAAVAYMFLGLAEVTEELSHPFATSLNGIALDAICRAAEISLAPHLDEAPPSPLQPVNHYLS